MTEGDESLIRGLENGLSALTTLPVSSLLGSLILAEIYVIITNSACLFLMAF